MADNRSREGKHYADPAILDWVNNVHVRHDTALETAFQAPLQHGMPEIMIGPAEGRFLQVLVGLAGARKVVEVGTLAGYSSICMARGLMPEGRMWSIEKDPAHAEIARKNIYEAGESTQIEVLVGAATDVLPTLEIHRPFDVVFVDADKGNYHFYGQWAADHLRPGGLLVGDNAFLFGNLLEDSETAQSMRAFHQQAAVYFDTTCIPTPDGLLLGVRKST